MCAAICQSLLVEPAIFSGASSPGEVADHASPLQALPEIWLTVQQPSALDRLLQSASDRMLEADAGGSLAGQLVGGGVYHGIC